MLRREQEIGIFGDFARNVDDVGGGEKFRDRNIVGGVVGVVFSCDPVDRGVEMRAGVFAAGEIIPVPGGAAAVVFGNFFEAEGPGLAEFRGELDCGGGGVEGLG